MTKTLTVLALFAIGASSQAMAAEAASVAEFEKCAARIKKDFVVPPASQDAQNLMVRAYCGTKPAK